VCNVCGAEFRDGMPLHSINATNLSIMLYDHNRSGSGLYAYAVQGRDFVTLPSCKLFTAIPSVGVVGTGRQRTLSTFNHRRIHEAKAAASCLNRSSMCDPVKIIKGDDYTGVHGCHTLQAHPTLRAPVSSSCTGGPSYSSCGKTLLSQGYMLPHYKMRAVGANACRSC
jgi:hypothetical protein